jgi:hypothetical protein
MQISGGGGGGYFGPKEIKYLVTAGGHFRVELTFHSRKRH